MSIEILNPRRNDMFSQEKGDDLINLVADIQEHSLEYRPSLNIPSDIVFGVEIGYHTKEKELPKKYFCHNYPHWYVHPTHIFKNEGILTPSRELYDTKESWTEIQAICAYLKKIKATPHPDTGCYVRVDSQILGENLIAWKRFCKLYTVYEDILFRFGYGEKINTLKEKITKSNPPTADKLYSSMSKIQNAKNARSLENPLQSFSPYNALNLHPIKFDFLDCHGHYIDFIDELYNVINFHNPNYTDNQIIIQNLINTYIKFVMAAANENLDEDLLDYRFKNERSSYQENPANYHMVDLHKALEFADLIFDNNYDKTCFLRQYFKDFNETFRQDKLIASESFTRKLEIEKPTIHIG